MVDLTFQRSWQKETFPFGRSGSGLMEAAPCCRDGGTFLIFSSHPFKKGIFWHIQDLFKFCNLEKKKRKVVEDSDWLLLLSLLINQM